MQFKRKKLTSLALAGLMFFSTLVDSGVLTYAADVKVEFSKVNGSAIEVADTVQYSLNQNSASFVSTNEMGTEWAGPLWIFDGQGKVAGNAAYCMALGKAASSSNQYAEVKAKDAINVISSKLAAIGEEKQAKIFNALSRYMYPTYTDSANIEFYMTRINETYKAGGQNVNGYPVIGGVPLTADWDDNRWFQTFAVITTASTIFGDKNDISNKKKAATLSEDEYRGLSQAVVWEMMGDLKPNGIKANISGDTWVHAGEVNADTGYITGAIYKSEGTTGSTEEKTEIKKLSVETSELYRIPTHLSKSELATLIGCAEGELGNYINLDLVAFGSTDGGALYRLQKALMIKATILKGTNMEGGNSIKYICSPEELLTRTGSFSDNTSNSQDIGNSATESNYYLFNFTELPQNNLKLSSGGVMNGGGSLMVTPWCYVQLQGGQFAACERDGSGNVKIYDTTNGTEIGVMKGLKLFRVPSAGGPITGEEVGPGMDTGFVYAITKDDLDAALADNKFAEEVNGERRFKQNIGAKWYLYDYASQEKLQPEEYVAAIGVPEQNRQGGQLTIQENSDTQNVFNVIKMDVDMLSNGFTYNAPAVLLKKIAKDADGNAVKVKGGGFSITDLDGNEIMGGLTVNENGYITATGTQGNSITLPKGEYLLVEKYVPQAADGSDIELKPIDPIQFSVPLGQQELLVENTEKPKTWWLFGKKTDAETGEVLNGAVLRLSKMRGDELLGYRDVGVIQQSPSETSDGVLPLQKQGYYAIWEIPPEPVGKGTPEEFGGPGTYVIHEVGAPNPIESKVLGNFGI